MLSLIHISLDRLLFATFLKGRTSSRDIWEEKGDMTPEAVSYTHLALLRQSATATPNPATLSAVGATFEEDDSDET